MSFSKKVKDELSGRYPSPRHCMLAELAAITLGCGEAIWGEDGVCGLWICTENEALAKKYFTLLQKIFHMDGTAVEQKRARGGSYVVSLQDGQEARRVCQAIKLERVCPEYDDFTISPIIVQNTCCKRSYLRGGFLAGGSISDPKKAYHFEIVFNAKEKAEQMQHVIQSFRIEAKMIRRKKYFVVYVKEGSQIVDLLNIMGAHQALMELENVRILKEVRNSVNRQVNCEAANINKTVRAATKQTGDIIYIRDSIGFGRLPDALREVAVLRVEYPEASLKELGEMLDPPIGKSGVNHRLKRLGSIAEGLRKAVGDMGEGFCGTP